MRYLRNSKALFFLNRMQRIQGRSFLLKVNKEVADGKLVSFMANVTNGGVTKDGHIVIKCDKKLDFKKGVQSIANKLDVDATDIQVLTTNYKVLPDDFLINYGDPTDWRYRFGKMECDEYLKRKADCPNIIKEHNESGNNIEEIQQDDDATTLYNYLDLEAVTRLPPIDQPWLQKMFPAGVDENKFLTELGHRFTNDAINTLSKILTTAETNKAIGLCKDGNEAAERGLIHYRQVKQIDATNDYLVEKAKHEQIASKPKLRGQLPLTFNKWGEKVTVNITGLPGDDITKQKHYYIYSNVAGWGKTTTIRKELIDKYPGVFVNDFHNAVNVPKDLQFLVFDEYSKKNKLGLDKLKSLANCDASGASLNRKSRGASYIPPRDVQVIILSNYSPYRVYGVWDKKLQKSVMDEYVLTSLNDRFHIIRLDGDNDAERRAWTSPSTWSDQEFTDEIEAMRPVEETRREIWLEKVCTLYKAREAVPVLGEFLALLKSQEDKDMAQRMYTRRMCKNNDPTIRFITPLKPLIDKVLKRNQDPAFQQRLTKKFKRALLSEDSFEESSQQQ